MSQESLPFAQDSELFRWGPVPSRFLYSSDFMPAVFVEYPKSYEYIWPNTLLLFKDKRMVWLNDAREVEDAGRKVFSRYMLKPATREGLRGQWRQVVEELMDLCSEIEHAELALLSDGDFLSLWQRFYDVMNRFWLPTIPQELGNYGSVSLLEDALRAELKDESARGSILEALTAPEELSFYQEEEIALAETDDLEQHAAEYFWLKNSYAGVEVLGTEFFAERKAKLASHVASTAQRHIEETRARKDAVVAKYGLTTAVTNVADGLRYGVEWQDERKKYIFISLHHKHLLVAEVARRSGKPLDVLLNYGSWEIGEFLQGKELPDWQSREAGEFAMHASPQIRMLAREVSSDYWDRYAEESADAEAAEVKGTVASRGPEPTVRGKVKILLDPSRLHDFDDGEVLVVPMTSPEYVFAMKKAVAIVTDAGGLTSHAAIVSRELRKPCIVGTKVATKVFANGDLVEVNTEKGTVIKVSP